MNNTKEKVKKQIEKWISSKQFLDIPSLFKIDDNIKCIVAITYKGTGKSTSCIRSICKNIDKKDYQAAWIRNTEKEYLNSKVDDSFTYWLIEEGKFEHYKVRSNGIYEVDDVTNRFDKGKLKVLFTTMNKAFNTASQNAIEHCKLIVYDEVINPDFHKPFLVRDFNNLVRTLQRKSNSKICIFGNAHQSDNDLLAGLGIEFDWESGKTQIIYRQEQGLLAIYLERYDIAALQEADTATDRLFMYSEEVQNFNEGKVATNNTWNVKNKLMIPYFKERYEPLFLFDINDKGTRITCAAGNIKAYKDFPASDVLFVERLSTNKYKKLQLPRLCFRPQDKFSDNFYVYESKDLSTIKFMIYKYSNGLLQFDTTWSRNYFTSNLLVYLKMFLQQERQTKK